MRYYNLNTDQGIFEISEVRRDALLREQIIELDPEYPDDYRLVDGPQRRLAILLLDGTGETEI